MAPPEKKGAVQPKTIAKACLYCRGRKIRCDTRRPSCSTCTAHNQTCEYRLEAPRRRPTFAEINSLRREKSALEDFVAQLRKASVEERASLLQSDPIVSNSISLSTSSQKTPPSDPDYGGLEYAGNLDHENEQSYQQTRRSSFAGASSPDDDLDVTLFISVDEAGKAASFGPSSALRYPTSNYGHAASPSTRALCPEQARNTLIANAVLQRQRERTLFAHPDIVGVPTELAMHLLDVHWARQHHTFLLTYRPAIMRDLQSGGPNCSPFLLNAIFACSSKFSSRLEVRDNPDDSSTAGRRFFQRCDELLATEGLLMQPTIPTVVGLLLLGSSHNARGEPSKGWLYTGYALRMVYDLGLHLDPKDTHQSPEEVEIRRRVFWGAFICDKLHSLYLGRPVTMNLRDFHVSHEFLDTIEEGELYIPYIDPQNPMPTITTSQHSPIYSISTFQQLCLLSKIMAKIINRYYVVGATVSTARASLQSIENALLSWRENLPTDLVFEPWKNENAIIACPPNIMNLHCIYHSLIILLYRPFISDGHLRSTVTPVQSWKRCTNAAHNITKIALSYKGAYGLKAAPYILSYSIYVACTIHVRNATAEAKGGGREHSSLLISSLECLDDLCSANPGVSRPANIIRRLISANKLDLALGDSPVNNCSPASLDLNAIFNTFPNLPDLGHDPLSMDFDGLERPIMDFSLLEDPLFGLMGGVDIPPGDYDMSQNTTLHP